MAIMVFFVIIWFAPMPPPDDPLDQIRGKTPEEIHEILTTPVYPPTSRRKRTTKKDKTEDS